MFAALTGASDNIPHFLKNVNLFFAGKQKNFGGRCQAASKAAEAVINRESGGPGNTPEHGTAESVPPVRRMVPAPAGRPS